jgi:hypothetical protein
MSIKEASAVMRILVDWPKPRGGLLLPWSRDNVICAREAGTERWLIVRFSQPLSKDGEHTVDADDVLAELDAPESWARNTVLTRGAKR